MIHEHSWGFSAISFDSNCGFQLGKATNRRKQWEVNHNKHMPDYDPVGMSILPQWTSFHGNRPVSVVSLHAYRSYIFTKLSCLINFSYSAASGVWFSPVQTLIVNLPHWGPTGPTNVTQSYTHWFHQQHPATRKRIPLVMRFGLEEELHSLWFIVSSFCVHQLTLKH